MRSFNYLEHMMSDGPFDPREALARREVMVAGLWATRTVMLDTDFVKDLFREEGIIDTVMDVRAWHSKSISISIISLPAARVKVVGLEPA